MDWLGYGCWKVSTPFSPISLDWRGTQIQDPTCFSHPNVFFLSFLKWCFFIRVFSDHPWINLKGYLWEHDAAYLSAMHLPKYWFFTQTLHGWERRARSSITGQLRARWVGVDGVGSRLGYCSLKMNPQLSWSKLEDVKEPKSLYTEWVKAYIDSGWGKELSWV